MSLLNRRVPLREAGWPRFAGTPNVELWFLILPQICHGSSPVAAYNRARPGGTETASAGVDSPISSGVTTLDRDQDRIRAEGDRLSEPARTETLSGGAATWPLHPFLFGAASVFSLYAANLRETTFADVAAAFGAVLALTLILFLGFGAALRRFGPRAAILASVALVGGLYYADLTLWLNRFVGAVHPEEIALPWTLAAIAVALVAIWFARFSMALPNAILNGIAFVLLAVPVWQVGAHAWKSTYELPASGASGGGAADLSFGGSAIAAPSLSGELPDIYYFIFDRYASQIRAFEGIRRRQPGLHRLSGGRRASTSPRAATRTT